MDNPKPDPLDSPAGKCIYKCQQGERVVAVLKAKEWFKGGHYLSPVFNDHFVVAEWIEYDSGESASCEGKRTIAICASIHDASLLYEKHGSEM